MEAQSGKYLIESGLTYTIIHPGGLVDKPGGCRELVVGVDDVMVDGEGTNTIPRDDVAETMVQALRHRAFRNRSFDLRSKLEGDGDPTSRFFAAPGAARGRDWIGSVRYRTKCGVSYLEAHDHRGGAATAARSVVAR